MPKLSIFKSCGVLLVCLLLSLGHDGAGELVQLAKALAAMPGDLSVIFETPMKEEKNGSVCT